MTNEAEKPVDSTNVPQPTGTVIPNHADQLRILLEQARQEVKQIVKREREGEKIDQEILSFRMR